MADEAYFTIPELRVVPDMSSDVRFPDAAVTAARGWIEAIIERECGTSFVLRTFTKTFDGNIAAGLDLAAMYVTSITSVTVAGVALSAPDLAALTIRSGIVRRPIGGYWVYGLGNTVVTFTAGYSVAPPADIKQAALQATRYRLLTFYGSLGPSDRAMSQSNEMGTTQFSTANADSGRPTGLPEVDAVITGWARKVNVYGFA